MEILSSLILTFSIISGQLIKLPIFTQGGITLLDIAVIVLCSLGILNLRSKLKKPPLFITCAFIFIFIALLSLVLTPLHLNPQEIFISFLYIVRLSTYFFLGWLIISGAFPTLRNNIPQILIFSGCGLAVLGLIQLMLLPDLRFLTKDGWDPHYFRTVSTFLDPNFLGGYFALTLVLLLQNPITTKKWNILFILVVYLGLLTTFSRGAYLAFLTGSTLLSLLNKSTKLGILTAIFTFGLFFGYANYQRAVAAPKNIDRTQSARFRLNTWQQGLTLFQQVPILGVGYNGYRYGLKEYHLAGEDFLRTHGASTNDSSLLFVASTTGVIGLTAYLFFLANLVKTAWSQYLQKNVWGIVCIAALSSIFIQSFFANALFYPFILVWIILISTKLAE